jgi:serine/threonine protein phosphatase PrpC
VDAPGRANEDRYVFCAPGLPAAERAGVGYVLAVADGMSQGGKGAFAAQKTVDVIRDIVLEERAIKLRPDLLAIKFSTANDAVVEGPGGGCAVTGVWIWEEPGNEPSLRVGWAHTGDTRLYFQHSGKWQIVTRDHARGSALTDFVGMGNGFIPQHGNLELEPGDWLVLTSDGVWGYACPLASRAVEGCEDATDAVTRLVGLARRNASPDDSTAIVVRVE